MINTQISLLRKEIKDLEAQRVMLKLLIKEYTDVAQRSTDNQMNGRKKICRKN